MNILHSLSFKSVNRHFNSRHIKYFINNCHTKIISKYEQGQYPEDDKKSREYFYYIDHQGMLFLDDSRMKNFTSCFKDKAFLKFFFRRLKLNTTKRYQEFPYLSLCGKERNFVRCDDLPIVFTHLLTKETKGGEKEYHLSYAHVGDSLTVPFEPEMVCMMIETGRVYHPAPEKVGGVGLIRSKLAIQLSPLFVFENGEENPPTQFKWQEKTIKLTQESLTALDKLEEVRKYSLGID